MSQQAATVRSVVDSVLRGCNQGRISMVRMQQVEARATGSDASARKKVTRETDGGLEKEAGGTQGGRAGRWLS